MSDEGRTFAALTEEGKEYYLETLGKDAMLADESFQVTDAKSANWVAQKLNELVSRRDLILAVANEEARKLNAQISWLEERFHTSLAVFAMGEIEGKKNRSFTLPCGVKLGVRKSPAHIEIADEDRVLEWAKSFMPEAVRTSERVLVSELSKLYKSTAEVPQGCVEVPEEDVFKWYPAKAAEFTRGDG